MARCIRCNLSAAWRSAARREKSLPSKVTLAAVRLARQIARALGALPVQIDARKKALYHAAAAFAAGHVLAIEEASVRLLMLAGMKRTEAVRALLQLTRQVLENFERLGPRAAWTGPLARGDYGVVADASGRDAIVAARIPQGLRRPE